MTNLVWLRRDLRCHDNPALRAACNNADKGVVALFILTPQMWELHHNAPVQIDLILRQLSDLKTQLAKLNIPLLIRKTTAKVNSVKTLQKVVTEHKITGLFYNIEYEVNEAKRDQIVEQWCRQAKILVSRFHDQVLLEPGTVLTGANKVYTVFTPFKRAAFKMLLNNGIPEPLALPKKQKPIKVAADSVPDTLPGFKSAVDPALWPAGEKTILKKLEQFCDERIQDYAKDRDCPAIAGTSRLSPYLAIGVISIRQCLLAALNVNQGRLESGRKGVDTWISELIWREFYRHILVGYPRVCRHQPFRANTKGIPWKNNEAHFAAWCDGQTGIPIVDAAMRQLKQTGWMHNRLRMIVAMFLSKNCLIDWRWGEAFFMQHLVDGDFASNNGGWQWSASTGTDAAPYFRIMNPVSQSTKFDPDGNFIREFCPELRELDSQAIHNPSEFVTTLPPGYPKPIVDFIRKHTIGS